MSGESFVPQPLTMFGGWVPNAAPEGLPAGLSWDCQDVDLVAGGVRTRPGLAAQFPTLTGQAFVNYLKTFPTLDGTNRLLVFDSLGNLYKENPAGSLQVVISALAEARSAGRKRNSAANIWRSATERLASTCRASSTTPISTA